MVFYVLCGGFGCGCAVVVMVGGGGGGGYGCCLLFKNIMLLYYLYYFNAMITSIKLLTFDILFDVL